jgi:hypothetical protein
VKSERQTGSPAPQSLHQPGLSKEAWRETDQETSRVITVHLHRCAGQEGVGTRSGEASAVSTRDDTFLLLMEGTIRKLAISH